MTTPDSQPAPLPATDRHDRLLRALAWAAIVVAVAVRFAFLESKPFWRDEAWVALLVDRPMSAVTDARAVPIGFLLLVNAVAGLVSLAPEITLRIVPMAAGLAALPLLARLARELGASRRAAVAAMWLAAGMQPFIYYSRELKPYSIDILLAVVLPLLLVRGFLAADATVRARYALAATLALTPWISFGAIFTASAVLGWGWIAALRSFDNARRRDLLLCSLAFTASFAAVFFFVLGDQATDPRIRDYWDFRLLATGEASLLRRTGVATWRYASILVTYLVPTWWPAFVAVAVVGAYTWRARWRMLLAWLTAATAAACIAAGVTDRYLIAQGRHLLFAAPVLVLWAAGGLDAAARAVSRRLGSRGPLVGHVIALGIPIVLALVWSVQSVEHRIGPYRSNWTEYFRYDVRQDVPKAIARALVLVPPSEPVLISDKCSYAFQFYARGRLRHATYCERHCPDFRRIARQWLAKVKNRGWVMMTDEEPRVMSKLLESAGFAHRQRAAVNGVRIWQVTRERRGPAGKSGPAGQWPPARQSPPPKQAAPAKQ